MVRTSFLTPMKYQSKRWFLAVLPSWIKLPSSRTYFKIFSHSGSSLRRNSTITNSIELRIKKYLWMGLALSKILKERFQWMFLRMQKKSRATWWRKELTLRKYGRMWDALSHLPHNLPRSYPWTSTTLQTNSKQWKESYNPPRYLNQSANSSPPSWGWSKSSRAFSRSTARRSTNPTRCFLSSNPSLSIGLLSVGSSLTITRRR